MEDYQIVQMYFERNDEAISQTARKYGKYCHTIAYNILRNFEDSEECVNETYWKAWHTIPPQRPQRLAAFLGKITRNLSIDVYRRYTTEKRGSGEMETALDELGDCVASLGSESDRFDEKILVDILNDFLASLSTEHRKIFMRRYWYVSTVKEIADEYGITESKVKMSLLRSRTRLKAVLEKEGIVL